MELSLVRERILDAPLVKSLPEAMRSRFAMSMFWVSESEDVSREQKLFNLGDIDTDRGCIVLEGMVRIITEDNTKKTIAAPDIFGEVQLFTPQGERTATVEVVVGGEIMTFSWKDFASVAGALYTDEEMDILKRHIADSAWKREDNLKEKTRLKAKKQAT